MLSAKKTLLPHKYNLKDSAFEIFISGETQNVCLSKLSMINHSKMLVHLFIFPSDFDVYHLWLSGYDENILNPSIENENKRCI